MLNPIYDKYIDTLLILIVLLILLSVFRPPDGEMFRHITSGVTIEHRTYGNLTFIDENIIIGSDIYKLSRDFRCAYDYNYGDDGCIEMATKQQGFIRRPSIVRTCRIICSAEFDVDAGNKESINAVNISMQKKGKI